MLYRIQFNNQDHIGRLFQGLSGPRIVGSPYGFSELQWDSEHSNGGCKLERML